MAKGEKNNNAKLSWDKVNQIRESKESSRVVAEQFGVCYNTVLKIRNFRLWKVPRK